MSVRRTFILLLGLLWLSPFAVYAADADNCLFCHQFRGLSRLDAGRQTVRLFFVDPEYVHELQGPHARLACTDCHPRDDVTVIPHRQVSPVDCTRTCHLVDPGGLERRFSHAEQASILERSVHPRELLQQLSLAGGPLLGPGQSACLFCHDEPVFRTAVPVMPALGATPDHALDRCQACHAEQVPVDVAYYLRHIASRLQRARPPLGQAQVCAVCHADPELVKAGKLKNTVASFVRSFHGKAALLGDERTASCVSCHAAPGTNAHLMLAHTNERSSVYPANVANSCRSVSCHPGADQRLSATSVHLDLPTAWGSLEFGVAAAFILLTIFSFGPSLAICLLELLQIVAGRHHEAGRAARSLAEAVLAHPEGRRRLLRFTLNQRIQHWVLVALFLTLAATGFPMKFADRTWARAVVDTLGGLQVTRNIHHWAGIALVVGFLTHLSYCLATLLRNAAAQNQAGRRVGLLQATWNLPMVIQPPDVRKAVHLLMYLVGLRGAPPSFGRFSVKEKFEYLGVFWGTTLLGLTGVLLWGEQVFTHYFSGRVLNIALIAHTYEAFLAVIHVGILHIVNVIFAPNVFPLSRATITGTTPTAELAEAHSELVEQAARQLGLAPPPGEKTDE